MRLRLPLAFKVILELLIVNQEYSQKELEWHPQDARVALALDREEELPTVPHEQPGTAMFQLRLGALALAVPVPPGRTSLCVTLFVVILFVLAAAALFAFVRDRRPEASVWEGFG